MEIKIHQTNSSNHIFNYPSSNAAFETVEHGAELVKLCHQCGNRSGTDRLIECEKCKLNTYCFDCFTKWYPNVSEEEFVTACPVCCNICNCKTCGSEFSPKDKQVKDSNGGLNDYQLVDASEILNGNHNSANTNGWLSPDHEPAVAEDFDISTPAVTLWRGITVTQEVNDVLQYVDEHFPNTFQGVKIRTPSLWLGVLNEFHLVMKRLSKTSVASLDENQIANIKEDLKEYEKMFDLSWAHERLDMVSKLKFGNEPLQNELLDIDESLKPVEKNVNECEKVFKEAHGNLLEARLAFNEIANTRKKKALEMEEKFGEDYEQVLNGPLGFGLLPEF